MATATTDGQEAGRRVALVIGNAAYRLGPPLANPATDAVAIAEALKRLEFDPVLQYQDLDKPGHDKALKQFAAVSKKADIAIVYYAGHGMELDGENYLLPVDAELADVSMLVFETTRLSDLMRAVDGAERFRFVILDACRDNPFRRQMQGIEATRSMMSRGLAAPPDFSGNTLVAYAAKHGTQAKDGKKGANSPFAAALLKHIETPNTDIRLLIGRIRDEVRAATDNVQEPAFYGSMGGTEIQLKHFASIPAQQPAAEESSALLKALEEERDWEKAQRADTIRAYEDFGRQWASGRFAEEALRKIDEIKEARDFEAARKDKGIDSLRSFLINWPNGNRADDARKILADRGAELAWDGGVKAMVAASTLNENFSADVLRNFLRDFPASKYAAEVRKRLEAVEKMQADDLDKAHSIIVYERYLRNWPQGARREEAKRLLEGGGDDRLWIEVQKNKTVAILERYIREWPKGRHASEAERLLPKWKFRERRNEWAIAGLGLSILGAFAVGAIALLIFLVPFLWNNANPFVNNIREIIANIIRPHQDDVHAGPAYNQTFEFPKLKSWPDNTGLDTTTLPSRTVTLGAGKINSTGTVGGGTSPFGHPLGETSKTDWSKFLSTTKPAGTQPDNTAVTSSGNAAAPPASGSSKPVANPFAPPDNGAHVPLTFDELIKSWDKSHPAAPSGNDKPAN